MDLNTLKNNPIISNSEQETELLATKIAQSLPVGSILALHGNLGAGKTVFSRGFARGLGITEPVSSPTYTIIQEYQLDDNNIFYHMDLYRIDNSISALGFGIDEFFADAQGYSLIEWPERISDILPPHTIHLQLTVTGEDSRSIQVIDAP